VLGAAAVLVALVRVDFVDDAKDKDAVCVVVVVIAGTVEYMMCG
jgi:hypothetical protein